MKLNIGCGSDIRNGYINIDFVSMPGVDKVVDITQFPWPFENSTVDEVLMLDVLEHVPYKKTAGVLSELWRIIKVGGHVDIQVPDFEHCALAATESGTYACNVCGCLSGKFVWSEMKCQCGTKLNDISDAAIMRLYGGQDREGNYHYNAFTNASLKRALRRAGFKSYTDLVYNENDETYWQNWNIKLTATKTDDDAW